MALTNVCDLRCPYCYAPKSSATIKTNRLVAWIDELAVNGCLGVGFGGGEPTLHKDLAFLCNYVTLHTEMAATITTHGHFLTDRRARSLEGKVHFIRLSMDGVAATYEELRGRSFANFLTCVKTASMIAPFGLNYVVNELTLADLDRAVSIASELGARQFLLLPERSVADRDGIASTTMQKLSEWVRAYAGGVPLAVSESGSEGLPTCDPLSAETGLRAYAHVDANGDLKRTSFDSQGVPIEADGLLAALRRLEERRP